MPYNRSSLLSVAAPDRNAGLNPAFRVNGLDAVDELSSGDVPDHVEGPIDRAETRSAREWFAQSPVTD